MTDGQDLKTIVESKVKQRPNARIRSYDITLNKFSEVETMDETRLPEVDSAKSIGQ